MKAMILAAGLGTRLRPLSNSVPKPLLPVAGRPLIMWNLFLLRRYGITEVIINLHHLGHLIEKELGDGSRFGMRLAYSRESVILGTGGGIKQAEGFFGGAPFMVLNGDTLLELDLGEVVGCHTKRGALATLVVRDDPEVERWGVVEVDEQQRILSITGRGRAAADPTVRPKRHMFAGVHIMDSRLLKPVPPEQKSSIIDAYVEAIERGDRVLGYRMEGYWSDVGNPESYARVQQDIDAGLINLAGRETVSEAR
jgi:NDP-sugar pyrophosphorylase family protein